jgi:hypothetical protein
MSQCSAQALARTKSPAYKRYAYLCAVLYCTYQVQATEDLLIDIWQGALTLPLNLPFTSFRKGIIAREKLLPIIKVSSVCATLLLLMHLLRCTGATLVCYNAC